MIKANELRIGNWVIIRGQNIKVDITNQGMNISSDATPIVIAPELLEKCGFDKEEKRAYSSIVPSIFYVFTKGVLTHNTIQDNWYIGKLNLANKPFYLHQLQNLYFALTGEELEVNL